MFGALLILRSPIPGDTSVYFIRIIRHVTDKRAFLPTLSLSPRETSIIHACTHTHTHTLPLERVKGRGRKGASCRYVKVASLIFLFYRDYVSRKCICVRARANVELRHCVVILIIMTSRGSKNCERLIDLLIETREITFASQRALFTVYLITF